jgi:hypothetical protein
MLLDAQSRTFTTLAQDATSETAGGVVRFEPLSSNLAYALEHVIARAIESIEQQS